MRATLVRAGAFAAAAVATLAMSPGLASADPPAGVTPAKADIVGVGSDTTQNIANAYSTLYNRTRTPKLYSFNATGTRTIRPAAGCAVITRPDGSGAGLSALLADTTGCIDFARSSRKPKADGTEKSLAFLAFARDGVTVAVATTTNAGANVTTAQLKAIFTCHATRWNQVGGKNSSTIKPILPQVKSGTRAFFLTTIGITDAEVGRCVVQGSQENDQNVLAGDPNKIAPFSVARYSLIVNTRQVRKVSLLKVDGTRPTTVVVQDRRNVTTLNGTYSAKYTRPVFNAVKRVNRVVPARLNAIFGAKGLICTNAEAKKIAVFQGFRPDCSGSLQTTG